MAGISSRYNQRGEQLHGVRLGPGRAHTWHLRGGVKSAAHSRYQRGEEMNPAWATVLSYRKFLRVNQDWYFLHNLISKINTEASENWCANNISAVCQNWMKSTNNRHRLQQPGKKRIRLMCNTTQETVPRPAEFQARIPHQESLSLNLRIECFTFHRDGYPICTSKFKLFTCPQFFVLHSIWHDRDSKVET